MQVLRIIYPQIGEKITNFIVARNCAFVCTVVAVGINTVDGLAVVLVSDLLI